MKPDYIPEPGNYYIMRGTWIIDKLTENFGVVTGIGEQHKCGTVKILWYNNKSSYISTRSFRSYLMSGRYAIDPDQHPYDKTSEYWEGGRDGM